MAQYNDRSKRVRRPDDVKTYSSLASQIQTPPLSDPTLLPYHKWLNETRTVSSLGNRQQPSTADHGRRDASEQGFRSYHRTATPLADGRTVQSALSWHMHEHGNIDSSVRRLARFVFSHSRIRSTFELILVSNVLTSSNTLRIPSASIPSIVLSPIYDFDRPQWHRHSSLLQCVSSRSSVMFESIQIDMINSQQRNR